jgi:hypothetical protein
MYFHYLLNYSIIVYIQSITCFCDFYLRFRSFTFVFLADTVVFRDERFILRNSVASAEQKPA